MNNNSYDETIRINSNKNVEEALSRCIDPSSNPQRVWLELTNRCQLNCTMCLRRESAGSNKDLPDTIIGKLSENVFNSVRYIALGGAGEPTLYKDFHGLLNRITRPNGPTLEFVTNGKLLNDEIIQTSVRNGVSVMISINGATAQTHETSRIGSDFNELITHLQTINRYKTALKSDMILGVNYVVLRNNIEEMSDFVELMASCGVEEIRFLTFDPGAPGMDRLVPDQDIRVLNRILMETRKTAHKHALCVRMPMFYRVENDPEYNENLQAESGKYPIPDLEKSTRINSSIYVGESWQCHEPWTTTFVDIHGIVKPCCLSLMQMGNLNTQTFEEIWHGKIYKELRRTINTDEMPEECRRCREYAHIWKNLGMFQKKPGLLNRLKSTLTRMFR